ncbi:hypothetical protein M9Y10_034942 [Tritrichomonas musculus]|uniref:Phosphodiesterase n=1 Tax=Tritrichomonas musculus TaxID=1915356 RepID=A0ABR2KGA9_9EUKA
MNQRSNSPPKSPKKQLRNFETDAPPNPQTPYLRNIRSSYQVPRLNVANPVSPSNQSFKKNNDPSSSNRASSAIGVTGFLPALKNSHQKNNSQAPTNDSESFRNRGPRVYGTLERYLRYDSILEAFLVNATNMPLHSAVEETISVILHASKVTFWQDIPSLHALYSERVHKMVKHSVGLVGFTFYTREVIKISNSAEHTSYCEEIDSLITPPGTIVILFPLWDSNNNICSVVEVSRDEGLDEFTEDDEEFIQFFIKKFKIYSPWVYSQKFPHLQCGELMQVMEIEQYLLLFHRRMASMFNCTKSEIWRYNGNTRILQMFHRTVVKVDITKAGIAGESIAKGYPINCAESKSQSTYCAEVDGAANESVLVMPLINPKQNLRYAIVVRGKKGIPVFTTEDETRLRMLAPYLVLALDNSERFSMKGSSHTRNSAEKRCVHYMKNLNTMLAEGTPISEILKETIQSIESLANSDRTFLFTYDKRRSLLVSQIATSMKSEVKKSVEDKIVGETYRSGKIFNISDVYEDLNFDSTFDLQNGYHTKSVLSVPVKNNRQEIIGVIQLLNRKDEKPFSNNDLSYVNIFGQFCGLLLENKVLYESTFENTLKITAFMDSTRVLANSKNMMFVLNDIMKNVKKIIGADRSSLFIYDEVVEALTTYITDSENMPQTIPLKNGIAAFSVNKKESIILNDAYHDPRFNKTIDFKTGYKTKSILSVPVVSSEGGVLGVVELINKKDGAFTKDDLSLLQSMTSLIAITLEKKKMKELIERGKTELEMSKWIGNFERTSYHTPSKLTFPSQKARNLYKLDFFCVDFNGIGLFKVAFTIFTSFQLLERFSITSELFFTFLYKIRSLYNDAPFHNWIHAIDVLQYYSYLIKSSGMDKVFTGLELFAICIASLCHDVGHQGYDNVYNVNAQTPYGLLYKGLGVMEMHHCSLTIYIITQDNANIFHALEKDELKKIWNYIIQMILATNMDQHLKLVKNANAIMDQGPINLANEQHRILAMKMLMQVANLSNAARPFDIAQKWFQLISEEFFKQGDVEKAQNMELSSEKNDRSNMSIPKLEIDFYEIYVLPLFMSVFRIFPELEASLDIVKENLTKWRETYEEELRKIELEKEKLRKEQELKEEEDNVEMEVQESVKLLDSGNAVDDNVNNVNNVNN